MYLVRVGADNENRGLGRVYLYGAEPKIEPGVLVPLTYVPQQ